jgi:hypothetical protein
VSLFLHGPVSTAKSEREWNLMVGRRRKRSNCERHRCASEILCIHASIYGEIFASIVYSSQLRVILKLLWHQEMRPSWPYPQNYRTSNFKLPWYLQR